MRRLALFAIPLLVLGGCQRSPTVPAAPEVTSAPSGEAADPLAANDEAAPGLADSEPRPMMQAQVVLDRLGFTPGVIDGKEGLSSRNAVAGFQEANGLPVTGQFDTATRDRLAQWSAIPATRVVTIPAAFAAGPFQAVPKKPADQAQLPELGYVSLEEKLAERFHTTIATLQMLNPGGVPAGAAGSQVPAPGATGTPGSAAETGVHFRAGQQVRVPNVGHDQIDSATLGDDPDWARTLAMLGVGTNQPQVDKIVVSKSKGVLKGYGADGKLVAVYTATMGSEHDPLPLGQWKVNGVARNPKFHYNPALFWDARPGDRKAMLPPGPNGPVGVVWIDLSKPHYGIHGTPNPESIGRAESHGCVRLTNWDAARLSLMVKPGTQVLFEP